VFVEKRKQSFIEDKPKWEVVFSNQNQFTRLSEIGNCQLAAIKTFSTVKP